MGKALSVARILLFYYCVVTELSFLGNFWKDNDLPLYVILNALLCIRFILLLRLWLWNILTNGQYPNCNSIKAFIIIIFFINIHERCKTNAFFYRDYWQRLFTYQWIADCGFNGMKHIFIQIFVQVELHVGSTIWFYG